MGNTFRYIAEKSTYRIRPIPGHPGMQEHLFYCRGADLPTKVPAGCNPRDQNIDKPTYKKVAESFKDTSDMTFHLKNKGITVLATSVKEIPNAGAGKCLLDVEIPSDLGDVDGHHTYQIITAYKEENPDQMVAIRILENLPKDLISCVAQGLNTSVQVTTATMADHSGYFSLVKSSLADRPYVEWIGWKENQTPISASVKTLVSLMWVCNPLLFAGSEAKHPNWIYTRGQAVFENGFYAPKNETLRGQMLKMANVLPLLLDLHIFVNEQVPNLLSKPKRSRSKIETVTSKAYELNIADLCQKKIVFPFKSPGLVGKYTLLMDTYMMVVLSGLRSLLQYNESTGYVEWKISEPLVYKILNASLKKILQHIVVQLKADRKDHNTTTKQPSLWGLSANEIMQSYMLHLEATRDQKDANRG